MRRSHLFVLCMLALAPSTALAVPAYTITDLGTLGGSFSFGNSINARGQVTGESFTADNSSIHAFRWDPVSGMQDLGTLGGTVGRNYSRGYGINARGQVTGESTFPEGNGSNAFLWDSAAGMRNLGTLGAPFSIGYSINASGQVTGESSSPSAVRHAFLWDPASGMQDLGTLAGDISRGYDVNSSGQVTGESTAPVGFGSHAFLWKPVSGMQDLGTLGGTESIGHGINDNGQVTGESTPPGGPYHAFLWDPVSGMQDLGTLGSNNSNSSEGRDINASEQVTGKSFSLDIGSEHAFLWDGMNMFDLNDLIPPGLGWTLSEGNAINDTGQITGSGFIGNQTHAFLMTPTTVTEVPEPGMLISTGVIGLSLLRRRWKLDTNASSSRSSKGLVQTAA